MADAYSDPFLSLVRQQGLIDDLQLEEVVEEHNRSGKPIRQILADFGLMDLETQLQLIADQLGTQVVELRDKQIDPDALRVITATMARMHQALPVAVYGNTGQVALADPMDPSKEDEFGHAIGREVQGVVADPTPIE